MYRRAVSETKRGGPPAFGKIKTGKTDVDTHPRVQVDSPLLDVSLHHEDGPPPPEPWRAFEIFTRNRVYVLDAGMICIEVIDLETRREDGSHPVLGGRLVGGQRTEGEHTEIAQPFPPRGFAAVFEQRRPDGAMRYVRTSQVKRVLARQRVCRIAAHLDTGWAR